MSIFDRSIRGNVASPLSGISASNTDYSNPRMPTTFNGNVQLALDYLLDALYPNYKGTVANPAALPVSATANDWYLVVDDGDGKSAGYVWTVINGSGSWVKRYDVDWSYEAILAETVNRTQYMYVAKYGVTDKDASGTPIAGTYAGQRVYGGDATAQNLSLTANSFDTTGYVQTDNTLRATSNNALDLGTSSLKWRSIYLGTSAILGTTTLSQGSLSDSGGSFSFGSNNVSTSGNLTGGALKTGTMTITGGNVADTSGGISFNALNLTTTGTITGASGSVFGHITLSNGSITDSGGSISFGTNDLSTSGTFQAGAITGTSFTTAAGAANISNVLISGQTVTTKAASSLNLILNADSGTVQVSAATLSVVGITASGNISATSGQVNGGNLRLASNTLSSTNANGNIILSPNGAGVTQVTSEIQPGTDASYPLGDTTHRFTNLFLSGSLGNGSSSIALSTLLLFSTLSTANTGDGIFWDGTKWIAHDPSSEVTHSSLLGLTTGDAGHTQFVMLAGRVGGQTIQGGTAASNNLVLESTANVTKGKILVKDELAPNSDATYSAGWSGVSLGDSSHNFVDIYSKGIHYGLRLDQYAGSGAYPVNSGQNIGRVIFDTSTNQLVVDNGTTWSVIGQQTYRSDTSWDGSTTTKDVTVSASMSDARNALWHLLDNSNNFEQIFCSIKPISASVVRITVNIALPAGSYRLLGIST